MLQSVLVLLVQNVAMDDRLDDRLDDCPDDRLELEKAARRGAIFLVTFLKVKNKHSSKEHHR